MPWALRVDIADDLRGVPEHDRSWRYVLRDDSARAHHGARADAHAGQQHRAGTNRRAALDPRRHRLRLILSAARVLVVRERGVRPDEHVIGDSQPVPQLHAALDRHAIADDDVVLDEDVIADVAVAADLRARKDVRKGPDACAGSDSAALAKRVGVQENAG
jgi:hypothetical protein